LEYSYNELRSIRFYLKILIRKDKKWHKSKGSADERWYDGRRNEEYFDRKYYRKYRFCCFDIFWPPGGIKQNRYLDLN